VHAEELGGEQWIAIMDEIPPARGNPIDSFGQVSSGLGHP
jgi:hypothetical protein